MAHFAEINSENIVVRVLVVPDEQEHRGQDFLANDLGLGGTWVQTSYNHKIRGRFAAAGYTYNPELDRFEPRKAHPAMVWDEEVYGYVPPTPKPALGYVWSKETGEWEPETPAE